MSVMTDPSYFLHGSNNLAKSIEAGLEDALNELPKPNDGCDAVQKLGFRQLPSIMLKANCGANQNCSVENTKDCPIGRLVYKEGEELLNRGA